MKNKIPRKLKKKLYGTRNNRLHLALVLLEKKNLRVLNKIVDHLTLKGKLSPLEILTKNMK